MSLSRFPDLLKRIERGTVAEEVPTLERHAEAAPGHVTAHVALARAYEMEDRWEAARRSWQRAYLLMPDSPLVRAGRERVARRARSADHAAASTADETVSEAVPSEVAERETPPGEGTPEEPTDDSSAERPDEQNQSPASFDDLDSLIEELEGARIEPNPEVDDAPPPNLENDVEDMVSPTLARIYEAQEQYAEAARVYRRLADETPDEADEYRRKVEEMRARAEEEE